LRHSTELCSEPLGRITAHTYADSRPSSKFGPDLFSKLRCPTLDESLFAYAFAKAVHYDDLLSGAKLGLIESGGGRSDLEGQLAQDKVWFSWRLC
jgi:hypothetical protein